MLLDAHSALIPLLNIHTGNTIEGFSTTVASLWVLDCRYPLIWIPGETH